jgi:hypothetical protein
MSSFEVARGPTTIKCRSTVVLVRMRCGGRGWISPGVCQLFHRREDRGKTWIMEVEPRCSIGVCQAE